MKYCYLKGGILRHTNNSPKRKNPFRSYMTTNQMYKLARTRKAQRWAGFNV